MDDHPEQSNKNSHNSDFEIIVPQSDPVIITEENLQSAFILVDDMSPLQNPHSEDSQKVQSSSKMHESEQETPQTKFESYNNIHQGQQELEKLPIINEQFNFKSQEKNIPEKIQEEQQFPVEYQESQTQFKPHGPPNHESPSQNLKQSHQEIGQTFQKSHYDSHNSRKDIEKAQQQDQSLQNMPPQKIAQIQQVQEQSQSNMLQNRPETQLIESRAQGEPSTYVNSQTEQDLQKKSQAQQMHQNSQKKSLNEYQFHAKEPFSQKGTTKQQQQYQEKQTLQPNVDFYLGNYKTPSGYSFNQVLLWRGDYRKLEARHDYIQWLFPNHYQSRFNSESFPLTSSEIEIFKGDKEIIEKYKSAFEMFMDFLGIEIQLEPLKLEMINKKRFTDALYRYTHNQLRITRIFDSLTDVGMVTYVKILINFIKNNANDIYEENYYKFDDDWKESEQFQKRKKHRYTRFF